MTGAVVGGVLGALVLVLFPGIGFAAGAAGGGLLASKLAGDIDRKFVKEVGAAIKPGNSALFLIVGEADRVAVQEVLKPYKGTVYTTSLPEESAEQLRRSLSERE